jgi:hypothetical protein
MRVGRCNYRESKSVSADERACTLVPREKKKTKLHCNYEVLKHSRISIRGFCAKWVRWRPQYSTFSPLVLLPFSQPCPFPSVLPKGVRLVYTLDSSGQLPTSPPHGYRRLITTASPNATPSIWPFCGIKCVFPTLISPWPGGWHRPVHHKMCTIKCVSLRSSTVGRYLARRP